MHQSYEVPLVYFNSECCTEIKGVTLMVYELLAYPKMGCMSNIELAGIL